MPPEIRLGLRANWRAFWLLVLVNAFVGAVVGLERVLMPLIAEQEFGVGSRAAVLAFLASFGGVKAVANLVAGRLGDRLGRKRILVIGWLIGVPVPFLVIWAPDWSWIVAANVLLGANQGLTWSTTVIMKIDLVGAERRGLAMGLNEFAGYVAVGLAAFASGELAGRFGLRPEPFYLGIAFVALGLAISVLLVRDTAPHVRHEVARHAATRQSTEAEPGAWHVFALGTWRDPALASVSQAGLVNNLNDGIAWGLFPLFFAARGLSLREIALLGAVYPLVWGITQLATGAVSDHIGRKWLIVFGMLIQGLALVGIVLVPGLGPWLVSAILLGLGTGMVYPTLLAAVGDVAAPQWRGSAVGVYRWWRDLGYVVGAVVGGGIADAFGNAAALASAGGLTALSGLLVALRMPETLPGRARHKNTPPADVQSAGGVRETGRQVDLSSRTPNTRTRGT